MEMADAIKGYRLSPQQEQLWSWQEAVPSFPDRAECDLAIEGSLNRDVLEIALQKIVERYEILRTSFQCLPGMTIPLQVIGDRATLSLAYRDLSELSDREREATIATLSQESSQTPATSENRSDKETEKKSPLQATLLALSSQKHLLRISVPSLCADAASFGILVEEICHCYAAAEKGEEPGTKPDAQIGEEIDEQLDEQLDESPIQYADVAEWLQEILEAEDAEIGKKYWRDLGAEGRNGNVPLALPLAKPVPEKVEFRPLAAIAINLPSYTINKINKVINEVASLEEFLLTCWLVLLWRLTGQENIFVYAAFDGRKYEELEGAVGLLARYLPLGDRFEPSLKFRERLQRVSQSVSESGKWQEYFTETIRPGFSFDFQEGKGSPEIEGLVFSIRRQSVVLAPFALGLSCIASPNEIIAEFQYDARRYASEDIERLAEQFQTLVESAADNPDAAIARLEILSDRQRYQLLVEFNQTNVSYPEEQCVHQLFESHVELYPEEIAAVCEDKQLTYRELNDRANQLARYLEKQGVKPEDLVAIYLPKSLEAIVSIIGVLKAGAAYLPIDPKLPLKRIAFMLKDARPALLLTQQEQMDAAGAASQELLEPENIVYLDSDWDKISRESSANLNGKVSSDNLIYVIYTSGSTGQPKGVAVERRQVLNYVRSIQKILDLPAKSSFATVSTFGADLGNTAIFASLCGGGCLHVISEERAWDPEALREYFARNPIDCLKIVPAHIAALLTCDRPEEILPRQRLVLGGEASSWDLIAQIQHFARSCKIINHYGPTETTIGSLTYTLENEEINPETNAIAQTVPIGRPIANTQIYILDSYMQPVPIGTTGELYIGGAGVSRGYLHRQELTAKKFVANPFSKDDIIYKTGDLARYLPDGNVEFIGRSDDMVKIRGFRIELPEISAVLAGHQAVRENVVLVREDKPGDKRLVAYIVPESNQQPTAKDLREFLQNQLPDYMVPGVFVLLDALPLTANGKIDRRALPSPETASSNSRKYVAPRTSIEEILVDIWADILGVERVGIEDNFFDLGGHSLLATRLVSRVRQTLRAEFSLNELFEEPTIASLSQILIVNEAKPGQTEKIARTLKKLQSMPAEAKEKMLAKVKGNKEKIPGL